MRIPSRSLPLAFLSTLIFFSTYFSFRSPNLSSLLPSHLPHRTGPLPSQIRWSNFAYVQYVTNRSYLCNSLMIFEALDRVGAKADRLMLYPQGWIVPTDNGSTSPYQSKLLARARDAYGVTLQPITVQTFVRGEPTWEDSFTKLLAFNQTAYKRVVVLDSDATVRKAMDELFFLPAAPIAMPRAYWMEQLFLSSQMLVVTPSREEWGRVEAVMREKEDSGFDMDILNALYNDSCTVIPHRGYTLLSGEFRGDDHKAYLGSDEAWDPMRALEEARFVHFSDWPRPKPWLRASEEIVEDMVPKCTDSTQGPDCMSRDIWLDLYEDFADRRERICGQRYDEG